jgi:cytoskeletal protein RodZ
MTSIGDTLRSERLRRGLKLEQVAAETKIRLHLLAAMEDDRFDCLPRGLLTRSFLQQYARKLELDEGEIIASLKEQFAEPSDPLPELPPERRILRTWHPPELIWVLMAVLACAGTYRLWPDRQRTTPDIEMSSVLPHPVSSRTQSPSTPDDPPTPESPHAMASDVGSITGLPGTLPPGATGAESVTGGGRPIHVAFSATEPVWLSVKSDGIQTYSGTLGEQQSKQFDASSKIMVLIGNAGGLEISFNGKPVGPIGAHGQVLWLTLTPNGASIAPRTPPASQSTSEDEEARL